MLRNNSTVFSLTPAQFRLVDTILQRFLPANTHVWVFGSRANGKNRKFSDLDLLLDQQGVALPEAVLLALREAFDESPLPYKVDLVDWNTLSDSFKRCIQNNKVPWTDANNA